MKVLGFVLFFCLDATASVFSKAPDDCAKHLLALKPVIQKLEAPKEEQAVLRGRLRERYLSHFYLRGITPVVNNVSDLVAAVEQGRGITFSPEVTSELKEFGFEKAETLDELNRLLGIVYVAQATAYMAKFDDAQLFFCGPPRVPSHTAHVRYVAASANWAAKEALELRTALTLSSNPYGGKDDPPLYALLSHSLTGLMGKVSNQTQKETAIDMLNKPLALHLSPEKTREFMERAGQAIWDEKISVGYREFLRVYVDFLVRNSIYPPYFDNPRKPFDFLDVID